MEIALLIGTYLAVLVGAVPALRELGFDVRIRGRQPIALEHPDFFRQSRPWQAWFALALNIICLAFASFAAYHFFRPRLIEKTIEKIVEKPVRQECPKCVTRTTTKQPEPKAAIEQHGDASGVVGGNIQEAPCSVTQVGGSGNNASTNCTPPSRERSEKELDDFQDRLATTHGMLRVILASSADDVLPLAQQLCERASKARWGLACPTDRSSTMGRSASGILCYSDDWSKPDTTAFKAAMSAAHLSCQYIAEAYNFGNVVIGGTGGVTLVIGSPTS